MDEGVDVESAVVEAGSEVVGGTVSVVSEVGGFVSMVASVEVATSVEIVSDVSVIFVVSFSARASNSKNSIENK